MNYSLWMWQWSPRSPCFHPFTGKHHKSRSHGWLSLSQPPHTNSHEISTARTFWHTKRITRHSNNTRTVPRHISWVTLSLKRVSEKNMFHSGECMVAHGWWGVRVPMLLHNAANNWWCTSQLLTCQRCLTHVVDHDGGFPWSTLGVAIS